MTMNTVSGEVHCDLREDKEVWVVSAHGKDLMANEWRRSTQVYAHYEPEIGCRFYVKADNAWNVLAEAADEWQQADNQQWVESQVRAMETKYHRNMKTLGVM
jgi:hypothetical protein